MLLNGKIFCDIFNSYQPRNGWRSEHKKIVILANGRLINCLDLKQNKNKKSPQEDKSIPMFKAFLQK